MDLINNTLSVLPSSLYLLMQRVLNGFYSIFAYVFQSKLKTIHDDVILITGGGRGLGRRLALHFAKFQPKHIILWGRNKGPLQQTAADVESLGVSCSFQVCDVSKREDVNVNFQHAVQSIGDITILVNNAGVVYGNLLLEGTDSEIENTFGVNTMAHLWTVKAVMPSMMANNRGHILCMSSMLGLMGLKRTASYTAAKHAVTAMMEGLRQEIVDHPGIHITLVHPYIIASEMFAGCQVRFPRLFPALSEDYVAEKSVHAVLKNKKQILLPWIMNVLIFVRSITPVKVLLPILKFLGVDRTMDTLHQER
ncbi:hypothetical protein CHS0354_016193 [Potamilus streckersoni]|uniref:Short-chain dehydrogenase/reductase 3 n=1 Tax=Potamilus streckersoni TaxID=2493646 RepID=A0AAE0RXE3_9BIVA|nr:hypothetical protein CHS0354_016193 [Potamilus streckersoni]